MGRGEKEQKQINNNKQENSKWIPPKESKIIRRRKEKKKKEKKARPFSMFNSHVLITFVHIYMNVNKRCLNQERKKK